ncbi:MAG: ABC transporter ATP-binding protein [Baekduia sp.]
MTTSLECRDLRYRYGDDYALGSASDGVDLTIERGELFALLGPSGCGKTTTLRIIGGFLQPTTGTVVIDGEDVTGREPYHRPTNTVFQSYALFPHMSLGQNVAFGLQMAGVGKAERERRAAEALELVGLPGLERRRVTELSGGQAQRAALARAIVNRPSVLLLDEPLGALDLRLRRQVQEELTRLKANTETTFVHVTHDQEEACAIADRIAVMDAGKIVQVDTPIALFREPRTSYVAQFIDAGTLVRGRATREGDVIQIASDDLRIVGSAPGWLGADRPVAAVIAPDRVTLEPVASPEASSRDDGVSGTIERVVFTGSVYEVYVRVSEELEIRSALTVDDMHALGESGAAGSRVLASWAPADVIFVEDEVAHSSAAAEMGLDTEPATLSA